MWLSPALFLFWLRGCLSLTGPGSVTGTVGGSLSVQCQYENQYKTNMKYWCQGDQDSDCKTIVDIKGQKEQRSGRVSIQDEVDSLTMTVTIEDLREYDAGSYWCKIQTIWIIDAWSRDPSVQVKVYVSPATTPMETTLPATTPTFPPVTVVPNLGISTKLQFTLWLWSLLSSIHIQSLLFLKLPLLLSMLCVVFWVNRPQTVPGGW